MKRTFEMVHADMIVENVLDVRTVNAQKQYLVKWRDYSTTHNEWIDGENVAPDLVQTFLQRKNLRTMLEKQLAKLKLERNALKQERSTLKRELAALKREMVSMKVELRNGKAIMKKEEMRLKELEMCAKRRAMHTVELAKRDRSFEEIEPEPSVNLPIKEE